MKCAKECPFEAITLENNLAYIDYSKCRLCRKCVSVCPTGAIHEVNFPARKITTDTPKTEVKSNVVNVPQTEATRTTAEIKPEKAVPAAEETAKPVERQEIKTTETVKPVETAKPVEEATEKMPEKTQEEKTATQQEIDFKI